MKLKKGDPVIVITGKDKGREGNVAQVLPTKNQVVVHGVNTAKKHLKARKANTQGGIIDKDMPIHISNVAILCGSCSNPTRVGYRFEGTDKIRVCRKCGKDI